MTQGRENTTEILLAYVEQRGPDECWPWNGWHNEQGYGRVEVNGRSYYAHRIIYALAHPGSINWEVKGSQATAVFVLHKCDNPGCCNPAHLFLGSHADNMADKSRKGRSPDFKGERGPRAKLTNKQAQEIRWLGSLGLASSEMAKVYGVSKPTVKSIIRGRAY